VGTRAERRMRVEVAALQVRMDEMQRNILIVDDEADLRNAVAALLQDEGYCRCR